MGMILISVQGGGCGASLIAGHRLTAFVSRYDHDPDSRRRAVGVPPTFYIITL